MLNYAIARICPVFFLVASVFFVGCDNASYLVSDDWVGEEEFALQEEGGEVVAMIREKFGPYPEKVFFGGHLWEGDTDGDGVMEKQIRAFWTVPAKSKSGYWRVLYSCNIWLEGGALVEDLRQSIYDGLVYAQKIN